MEKNDGKDWISSLNAVLQRQGKQFRFKLLKQAAENQGVSEVGLYIKDKLISKGRGKNKRLAEHDAAKKALEWAAHQYRSIRSDLEQLAQAKGERNEQLTLELFKHPPFPLPTWFVDIRKATPEEDKRGIDAVVTTTDLGNLLLQVKSSRAGIRKFLGRGRRSSLIGLYVLNPEHNEVRRLRGALKVLDDLRSEILQRRGQHEDDFLEHIE